MASLASTPLDIQPKWRCIQRPLSIHRKRLNLPPIHIGKSIRPGQISHPQHLAARMKHTLFRATEDLRHVPSRAVRKRVFTQRLVEELTVREDFLRELRFDQVFLPNGMKSVQDTTELGQAVRARRKALGVTQIELAGLAGVGERFVSEVERGKATAEMGKVLKLLGRLGLLVYILPKGDLKDKAQR